MDEKKEKPQSGERDIKEPKVCVLVRGEVLKGLSYKREEALLRWSKAVNTVEAAKYNGVELGLSAAIQVVKNIKGEWL